MTPISSSDCVDQPQAGGGPAAPLASPAHPQGVMPLNGPAPVAVSLSAPAAPLNAPPPAPTLGANQRMTLAGDVIDAPVPMSAPPAGNSQYKPRTNYNTPQPAEEREKSGSNPVVVGLVFLLLFGGGGGGWYYWMHRTNPKTQALTAYKSIIHQDWKTLYTVASLSDADKKVTPDAETFAQNMTSKYQTLGSSMPAQKQILDMIKDNNTMKVGEPTITGDKADVPTSLDLSFAGRSVTMKGVAHMVNEGGIWKLDGGDDAKMQKMGIDLIGKPDMGSVSGGR